MKRTSTRNKPEIYPISTVPTKRLESDEWISVEIILISGKTKRKGYYDARGSIAGGKYFYYRKNSIEDCANLKKFPTHWYYA